ncbi:histidine kinase [Sesbania bispinosa]|nr:histidine kinase [Sesbania bispinosa]
MGHLGEFDQLIFGMLDPNQRCFGTFRAKSQPDVLLRPDFRTRSHHLSYARLKLGVVSR